MKIFNIVVYNNPFPEPKTKDIRSFIVIDNSPTNAAQAVVRKMQLNHFMFSTLVKHNKNLWSTEISDCLIIIQRDKISAFRYLKLRLGGRKCIES